MKRLTATPELFVKIYSRRETFFDDNAFSLSAVNKIGPLDILPGHASLISILDECLIRVDTPKGIQEFPIEHGLIKVSTDSVVIYVDVEDKEHV